MQTIHVTCSIPFFFLCIDDLFKFFYFLFVCYGWALGSCTSVSVHIAKTILSFSFIDASLTSSGNTSLPTPARAESGLSGRREESQVWVSSSLTPEPSGTFFQGEQDTYQRRLSYRTANISDKLSTYSIKGLMSHAMQLPSIIWLPRTLLLLLLFERDGQFSNAIVNEASSPRSRTQLKVVCGALC